MELARPAGDADHAVCAHLVGEALAHAGSMRGGPALIGASTTDDLLTRWRGDPEGAAGTEGAALFVGEFEGAVVGVLGVVATAAAGGRRGRIECCYVETAARAVGVGTSLMEAAVAWCAGAGCAEVDALALPGDRSTKQRLEASGFTARLLTLSRRLG
ncbi:MAG TPA: GNAT family N-acetyltransferase [Acidimicrobiales bacterium]|nr:GNAT family N-acetyltransferase [Acidimicrobiales bacterium]